MLPHPDLKPAYEKVVWLYVYRNFKRDEDDRQAERISLRFGVTSWPQLFLVDPATLKILTHTGRTTESFLAAVERTQVGRASDSSAHGRLMAAETRAVDLEKKPSKRKALKALIDEDVVVRARALEVLAEKAPKEIAKRASDLLQVPNDPFRYLVCQALAKEGDVRAADALEALVKEPKDSLNPNVLRIRAVQALAACGDADSVAVIAPHAASGVWRNGLTGIAIDALAGIAKRHKHAREAIAKVLRSAYPEPPLEDERGIRACTALAKRIHKALADPRPFPDVYDAAARKLLMTEPN